MTAHALGSLEARLARGETATREDVASLCRGQDLVSIGVIGDLVRQACTGTRVTYGRVLSCEGDVPDAIGQAGEVRLVGTPASIDDARRRVRAAVARAGGRVVTGFSLADLVSLAGDDRDRLRDVAADLAQDGLVAVAEVAIDRAISDAAAIAQVQAVRAGGLETWRLTIDDAEGLDVRMALIERARALVWLLGAGVLISFSVWTTVLWTRFPKELAFLVVLVTLVSNALLWLFTSWWLPNRKTTFRAMLPSAAAGAAMLEALKVIGGIWVPHLVTRSSELWGTIGAVFALIAWILFFGRVVVYVTIIEVLEAERLGQKKRHGDLLP